MHALRHTSLAARDTGSLFYHIRGRPLFGVLCTDRSCHTSPGRLRCHYRYTVSSVSAPCDPDRTGPGEYVVKGSMKGFGVSTGV